MFWVRIFLFLLFSQDLVAQNQCLNLFAQSSPADGRFGYQLKGKITIELKPTFSQRVNTLMGEWKGWLSSHFQFPSFRLVPMPADFRSSGYSPITKELFLGLITGRYKESDREVAMAHEFGHALFFENIVIEQNGVKTSFNELGARAREEMAQLRTNSEFNSLQKEMAELNQTIQVAQKVGGQEQLVEQLKSQLSEREESQFFKSRKLCL